MQTHPLLTDLELILERTLPLWEQVRGQRIFITGGTGFFGKWLLESFVWANKKLNLDASATILTRNPAAFEKKYPHLFQQPSLQFYTGNIVDFIFPAGEFSHVIHAATEVNTSLNQNNPALMFDTIVSGTRRALEFARFCGAHCFLLVSSGAIYGKQPADVTHLSEEYVSDLKVNDSASAYAAGKYAAEHLCYLHAKQHNLEIKIARCFAFVGPYLPLDTHFAIGNFIRDGLKGGPIHVAGDGTPYRSYLYAADLMVWLWTILFCGESLRPYNVGSDEALSIAEIAYLVAKTFTPHLTVTVAKPPLPTILPERYVPDVSRARNELGLIPTVNLADAIQFTANWYRN